MKRKKITAIVMAVLLAVTLFCVTGAAFDGNDYDYDYDGGDSDGGGDLWIFYYIFRVLAEFLGVPGAIILTLIIMGIVIILKRASKRKHEGGHEVRSSSGAEGMGVYLQDRTSEIEAIIRRYDPTFNAAEFIARSNKVYLEIEDAWCKRDLTPVKQHLHTNLYKTTETQLSQVIQRDITYHYENIQLIRAYLNSYARDEQYEYLTVYLNARMIDYQTDASGSIVKGDKNTMWNLRYKMKYMRSVGITTENGGTSQLNCPNCGAPLDMASAGKCVYCGSEITTGRHDWLLSDFGTVRNDTRDEGISISDNNL